MTMSTQFIRTNGINLHAILAGPADGTPVILLHGFPDASFGWQAQIQALAQAGFYVIAPDQRGYNLSDKPGGIENYALDLLAADILGLADALGLAQFNLAGHDWGAMVSWKLADAEPERVRRLAILNVPHPKVLNQFLRTRWEQRVKSWYMAFFQVPVLPEMTLRTFEWKPVTGQMCKTYSEAELKRYKETWSQPGAMRAMLNWYRCALRHPAQKVPGKKVQVPTLIIWGKRDAYLMEQMAPASLALCENGRLEMVEDATHWVHQDQPERVNQLLIEHFQAG